MIEWLQLSDNDRLISLQQANIKSGIAAKVIEKDWWVTLVLKAIFEGEYAAQLSFKGGTSLSKGWKLIDRFSEDIDLAIDLGFLGFDDHLSKSAVKRLKRAACDFTGRFGDMLHPIPWQTDHPFCWQRNVSDALA